MKKRICISCGKECHGTHCMECVKKNKHGRVSQKIKKWKK